MEVGRCVVVESGEAQERTSGDAVDGRLCIDIKSGRGPGANEQGDLMQDGRIDMATNGIFIGHASFRAIDENTDVILLEIPQDVIEATNKEFGTSAYTIPAGSYSNQDADINTMALGAMVVTTDQMEDAVAEALAKAFLENIDEIRGVHGAMKQLTPELMVSQTVLPFHPGAEKVYKDAGLIE